MTACTDINDRSFSLSLQKASQKGSDPPTLADFNRHVRPLIASHWEDVGVELLSEHNQSQIEIIKVNCHSDVEKCCTNLFDVWTQRQPNDVTWWRLIEAVKNIGLVKEAEKIEKMFLIPSDHTNQGTSPKLDVILSPTKTEDHQLVDTKCAVDELDEEVRHEYAKFMRDLLKLFVELSVPTDDILLSFSCLEDDQVISNDMRRSTNIKSFMRALSKTQSWYNFGTTARLACMHGETKGERLVEEYEEKLKIHLLKRIKLPVAQKAERIVIKFNEKREKFTEEKIIKFRRTVSRVLMLEMRQFMFVSIEDGCVQLTFLLPSTIIPCVKQAMNTINDDLKEWKVISVRVRGEVVWQPTSRNEGHHTVNVPRDEPKRLKTLPSSSSSVYTCNVRDPTHQKKPSRQLMRSVPLTSPHATPQPITFKTVMTRIYRTMCQPRRKCYILLLVIIMLVILYLYYSAISSL